jgi:hypothetical protein
MDRSGRKQTRGWRVRIIKRAITLAVTKAIFEVVTATRSAQDSRASKNYGSIRAIAFEAARLHPFSPPDDFRTVELALDFDINAGAAVSIPFSQLDSRLTMPVAFLNDDLIPVSAVAANRHIGFPHAILRACRPNASFVANFHGTGGAGEHARAGQDGCQDPYMASSHRGLLFRFITNRQRHH